MLSNETMCVPIYVSTYLHTYLYTYVHMYVWMHISNDLSFNYLMTFTSDLNKSHRNLHFLSIGNSEKNKIIIQEMCRRIIYPPCDNTLISSIL